MRPGAGRPVLAGIKALSLKGLIVAAGRMVLIRFKPGKLLLGESLMFSNSYAHRTFGKEQRAGKETENERRKGGFCARKRKNQAGFISLNETGRPNLPGVQK
jgi:hypothetical protein